MALMSVFMLTVFTFTSCGDDDGGEDAPTPTEFTIKYDANGGTGTIANTTYKAGEKVTLSDGSGFTREGYTFAGWSDKADGTSLDVNAIANKNVTLYAVWTKTGDAPEAKFTVKYDPNGGTGSIANTTFKVGEQPVISDGRGFTREGYTFAGWSTTPNGTEIDASAFNGKDVTLYAVWKKDEEQQPVDFTVVAKVNGVDGKNASVFGYIDGLAGLNIDLSKIQGYGFSVEPKGSELSATSPQVEATVDMAKGGFDGTITKEPGDYVFVAFVIYDGNVKVSAPVEFTIEAGNGGNGGNGGETKNATAFYPTGISPDKSVVAWYASTSELGTKTEAIFLFDDGSLIYTVSIEKDNVSIVRAVTDAYMNFPLVYTLNGGTTENANANVGIKLAPTAYSATIVNGVLSISIPEVIDGSFSIQDNANIPAPSDPL